MGIDAKLYNINSRKSYWLGRYYKYSDLLNDIYLGSGDTYKLLTNGDLIRLAYSLSSSDLGYLEEAALLRDIANNTQDGLYVIISEDDTNIYGILERLTVNRTSNELVDSLMLWAAQVNPDSIGDDTKRKLFTFKSIVDKIVSKFSNIELSDATAEELEAKYGYEKNESNKEPS